MDQLPIDVVSRVLHVATAIVLVGGSVFLRLVLMPAADGLAEAEHDALKERLMSRWKRIVHIGILLLLLTGLYNYVGVTRGQHEGDSLYHAMVGTKILLALVLFFLASALVGRSAALQGLRDKAKTTLLVMITLAAIIVAISEFVKVRGIPDSSPSPGDSPTQVQE